VLSICQHKKSLSDESTDKSSSQDSESGRNSSDDSKRFNLSRYLMEQGIVKNTSPVAVNNSALYF
jgi:hypothetical protein